MMGMFSKACGGLIDLLMMENKHVSMFCLMHMVPPGKGKKTIDKLKSGHSVYSGRLQSSMYLIISEGNTRC